MYGPPNSPLMQVAKKKQAEHLEAVRRLEAQLAAAEGARYELEQQLGLARSQLADARALMDSTQVGQRGMRAWVWKRWWCVCVRVCFEGRGAGGHRVRGRELP